MKEETRDRTDNLANIGVISPFPSKKNALLLHCAVEQRLARQAHNLEVVGSIPTGAISNLN